MSIMTRSSSYLLLFVTLLSFHAANAASLNQPQDVTSQGFSDERITDMNGKEPKPGDMVQILRGVYEHWGVYIGGGYVVHFIANSSRLLVFSGEMGIVKKNKLRDLVVAYPWRISNIMDDKYKPRPVEDIVKDACEQVGTKKPFSLIDYNCEHFANELRYGKKNSLQVQNVGQTVLAAGLEAIIWVGTVITSAVQSKH